MIGYQDRSLCNNQGDVPFWFSTCAPALQLKKIDKKHHWNKMSVDLKMIWLQVIITYEIFIELKLIYKTLPVFTDLGHGKFSWFLTMLMAYCKTAVSPKVQRYCASNNKDNGENEYQMFWIWLFDLKLFQPLWNSHPLVMPNVTTLTYKVALLKVKVTYSKRVLKWDIIDIS